MNPNTLKAIVVIVVVDLVELAKVYIFKDDPQYKALYTFAPIVLCGIAYLIIALVNKEPVWSSIMVGVTLGTTAMGSYDALATIIKGWKDKTPKQIVSEVGEVIDGKQKEIEKK